MRPVDAGRAVAQAIDKLRLGAIAGERGVLIERTIDRRVGPVRGRCRSGSSRWCASCAVGGALGARSAASSRCTCRWRAAARPERAFGVGGPIGESSGPSGVARRLVERLLALHDTTLEVRGSTAACALRRPASGRTDDAAPPLQGVEIVAVDDEADARTVLRAILEQHGGEVRTAGSAAEALSLVSSWRPDVLVSDIGMPDADGYELMLRVRALGQKGGGFVRAIALTAYASEEDARLARHAGFDRHLPKPVDAAQLVRRPRRAARALGTPDPRVSFVARRTALSVGGRRVGDGCFSHFGESCPTPASAAQ